MTFILIIIMYTRADSNKNINLLKDIYDSACKEK